MELHAIIFHHNDLDGRLAGYIMYNWLKSKTYIDKIKTYEVDYNMNIPFDDLIQGKNVVYEIIIVDFSFSLEQLAALKDRGVSQANIIWIDHHASAIKKYKDLNLGGLRAIGLSGAELAYLYTRGEGDLIHDETQYGVPYISEKVYKENYFDKFPAQIRTAGNYDCWRFTDDDALTTEARALKCGMDLCWDKAKLSTEDNGLLWDDFLKGYAFYNSLISSGRVVLNYNAQMAKKTCAKNAFETRLVKKKYSDIKIIAINSDNHTSLLFQSVYNDYEVGIVFNFTNRDGKRDMLFSFYRLGMNPDKVIDCGEIAASYGGGGHAGAAGCHTEGDLIFK